MKMTVIGLVQALAAALFLAVGAQQKNPELMRAERSGAALRMVLRVLDDDKKPVPNAKVNVLMGMNFRERSYHIKGLTDAAGVFVVEGNTTGNEVEINVKKEGYYKSAKKLCLIKHGEEFEVKKGRWQPWGMEMPVSLRKIVDPIDHLVIEKKNYVIPATNAWFGFDMQIGDWVAPHGKGKETDFSICLRWDGKPLYYSKCSEIDVRFDASKMAGFYAWTNVVGSIFVGVYHADTNQQYAATTWLSTSLKNGEISSAGFPEYGSLVTRSRCVFDENRNLVGANYGIIKGILVEGGWDGKALMWIRYFFNPTPNDTNLEPTMRSPSE